MFCCFFLDGGNDTFCCSSHQIQLLKDNFGAALALVGRCPSCARNLRMVFCYMTCHPHQSHFLEPLSTMDVETPEGNHSVVASIKFHVRDSYIHGLYDSCKEVTNPSSNSLAVAMFCGSWGEMCDANRYTSTKSYHNRHISQLLICLRDLASLT